MAAGILGLHGLDVLIRMIQRKRDTGTARSLFLAGKIAVTQT